MRGTWWALVLLTAACSKGGEGVGDDTADTSGDTADTDTEDTDTAPPPTPATYGPHNGVVFDMAPVNWVPLEFTQPIYQDEIAGFDIAITIGANVTGKTDVQMTVDSKLDRENDGDYVQYFTGLKDGGKLDAEMHINFPMIINLDGLPIDISSLVIDQMEDGILPPDLEFDHVFSTHIFDTLNLSGDSESTTYVATPYTWTWESGTIDPASWAPYIALKLEADINYETKYVATSYEIRDVTSDALVATQLKKADRSDVESYVGELGSEESQIRFDAKAKGELRNDLDLDLTLTVTMWSVIIDPPISFEVPYSVNLGDEGQWKITFDEERVTHAKQ